VRGGLLTEACGIPFGRSADTGDSKLKEINSVELGVQRQASAVARGAAYVCPCQGAA
jgi:hypothetical protein